MRPSSLIDLNASVYSVSLILSFAKLFVKTLASTARIPNRYRSFPLSEDVAAFFVDVAGVVERGGVHH